MFSDRFPQPCQQLVEIQREPLACSRSSSSGTSTTPVPAQVAMTASCGVLPPAATTTTASGASVRTKVTPLLRAMQWEQHKEHKDGTTLVTIAFSYLALLSVYGTSSPPSI